MLTINARTYAKNDSEAINSLFNAKGTVSGFYKVKANGILLLNLQKQPFAFIVNNSHGEKFFVSCTRNAEGKLFYSFALGTIIAEQLGFDSYSYSQQREAAVDAIQQIGA